MKAHQYQEFLKTGVGLVFVIVAVSILIPEGYRELKKGYDSLNWPTAEGVVISSEIETVRKKNSVLVVAYALCSIRFADHHQPKRAKKT